MVGNCRSSAALPSPHIGVTLSITGVSKDVDGVIDVWLAIVMTQSTREPTPWDVRHDSVWWLTTTVQLVAVKVALGKPTAEYCTSSTAASDTDPKPEPMISTCAHAKKTQGCVQKRLSSSHIILITTTTINSTAETLWETIQAERPRVCVDGS